MPWYMWIGVVLYCALELGDETLNVNDEQIIHTIFDIASEILQMSNYEKNTDRLIRLILNEEH